MSLIAADGLTRRGLRSAKPQCDVWFNHACDDLAISQLCCVPGMFGSSEVQVLHPT